MDRELMSITKEEGTTEKALERVEGVVEKGRRPNSHRTAFSEVGRSGIRRFGGQLYEEFLTSLRGLQGIRVYREMRDNDPIIGAAMYAIEQIIEKAPWNIRPYGKSNLDKEAANFLKSCLMDMEHSWQDFIGETLSMLTYGWNFSEIVYKIRKGANNDPEISSRENDGLIGWRKISRRVQSSFYNWIFDEDSGDLIAFQQMTPPDYTVRTIPLAKGILFRMKLEGENPEGRSILRNAYRPYYFRKNIEEIEAIGIERDLVGLPVIGVPEGFDIDSEEGAGVRAQISTIISNLRRDEQDGICLPSGFTISLLQIGSSRRQFDSDKIINRLDKRIAATILAQFIMLGMDRVGSFALSRNQNDLFLAAVQSILSNIASTLNRVAVPRLFALNPKFAPLGSKIPRLSPGKVTDPNLDELSNYVNRLTKTGMMLPKRRILTSLEGLAGLSNADIDQVGDIEIEGEGEELVEAPQLPGLRQDPAALKAKQVTQKVTQRQSQGDQNLDGSFNGKNKKQKVTIKPTGDLGV
jgi:hypothetical protein